MTREKDEPVVMTVKWASGGFPLNTIKGWILEGVLNIQAGYVKAQDFLTNGKVSKENFWILSVLCYWDEKKEEFVLFKSY